MSLSDLIERLGKTIFEAPFDAALAPKDAPMGNYYAAHYWLGMIYQGQGKKDLARGEYQSALAVNPKGDDAKKALDALK